MGAGGDLPGREDGEVVVGGDRDREDDFGDGDEPLCVVCGGEGYVHGEDIESCYDFGWIDAGGTYRCSSCLGSGLAKDMTWC